MTLFIKYFKVFSLFILTNLVFSDAMALVLKKQCGEFVYSVKITHALKLYEARYTLFYQKTKGKKKIFYKTVSGMNLDAFCAQDTKGKYLMLFQEACTGNACVENIYGVYDPQKNKFLLKPADWPEGNTKQVDRVLGYHHPVLDLEDEDKYIFCCSKVIGELRYPNR